MSKAIVICFDRWHAGFLGLYGNPWVDSPALDEFAVSAAVFDQHFAENLAPEAAQHAWWTGRCQFPLNEQQQRREPSWLPLLAEHKVSSILLHDPDAKLPIHPRSFAASRAISLDDVARIHYEEDAPRFVKAAVQRIQKMGQDPDLPELFWIHASGLPLDTHSLAYDDLYADDASVSPRGNTAQLAPDDQEDDQEREEKDVDSSDRPNDGSDQSEPENVDDDEEDEMIVFPPRFWRRARSSPRELADARLRGAGWDAVSSDIHKSTSTAGAASAIDWQRRRDLYTAQVAQWDAWVGKIIEAALQLAKTSQLMIVFTAAAGQHLGEHFEASDSPVLYEESIHVPLLIHVPHTDPFAGRRLALTSAVDLPVTILDWFGIPLPSEPVLDGVSLLPVIQNDHPLSRQEVFVGDESRIGVRTQDFYYRQEPQRGPDDESIFVKPDDRWEADNMLRQLPDAADSLRATARAFVEQVRTRSDATVDVS